MIRAAVIGNPILHSLSPVLAHQLFQISGMDGHYSRICGSDFDDVINLVNYLELDYINITSPFKSEATKLGYIMQSTAFETKLVNTILFNSSQAIALNTDTFAISEILKQLPQKNFKRALIIGGGDTALISYLVLKNFAEEVIGVSIRDSNIQYYQVFNFDELIKTDCKFDLIINTHPKQAFNYPDTFFKDSIVIDAIYHKPWLNAFQTQLYIEGLEWLKLQGMKSYEYAIDIDTSDFEINSDFAYHEKRNIYLSGFMKSGKTTIGKELAIRLHYDFIDLDEYIEMITGMTISNIFNTFGENGFREIESNALKEISMRTKTIISLGGGTVLNSLNVDIIKSSGYIIWIFNYLREIMERKDNTDRPLFNGNVAALYESRIEAYFESSDMIIHNNQLDKTIVLLENEIRNTL
jgi:shikimate kinase